MSKKLISIVLPAYKEQKNVPLMYVALQSEVISKISDRYDYEIIFVNDGSPDGGKTWEEIVTLHKKDAKVIGIDLSRNFGHQAALTAGLEYANGDIIISMDCDLQDPAILAYNMLQKIESGAEVVYARRVNRNDSFMKKYTAIVYYKILDMISDTKIPRNVGDCRAITRKVLKAFLGLKEKDRYIRGMFARLGFRTEFVDFDRPERIHGETGYTWKKMIKLATDGLVNFSTFPLKLGAYIGVTMMILSFLFFIYICLDVFVNSTFYPLYKWLSVGMFGLMGLQFVFMRILAEYLGRVYNESRERPVYVINEILS